MWKSIVLSITLAVPIAGKVDKSSDGYQDREVPGPSQETQWVLRKQTKLGSC